MTAFKVLAVADGMIPSVELVLQKPLAYLADTGALIYRLAIIGEPNLVNELDDVDLLILMRCCQPEALELADAAVSLGIPFIYAIDDDFEALDPSTPLGAHYHSTNAWQRLLSTCGKASQVWAFSEALRAKIATVQTCVVIPPAIASLEVIDSLRNLVVIGERVSDGSYVEGKVIGYGATTLHSADLVPLTPALEQLLSDLPTLRMEFVGVRCEPLVDHPRVSHFDHLPSVDAFYAFVLSRQWDASIAPLIRSPFNDAKTDNKYRECAALGIPAVYTHAPPYWRSVIHNHNGLFAANPEEWYRALRRLVTEDTLAKSIAQHARHDVERRYSLASVSERYLRYMKSAMSPARRIMVVAPDIPTTDIDVVRPFGKLAAEGGIEWRWSVGPENNQADLDWADMLVIVRDVEAPALWCARAAREVRGIPVVYSLDDDFLAIPENLGDLTSYYRAPAIIAGLQELLRTADLVKASTAGIATRVAAYSDRVVQAPYGFDFSQLDGLAQRAHPGQQVVIGFFGSAAHVGAVNVILGALERVARDAPNVCFEFFGPHSDSFEALGRVTFIPYMKSSTESLRLLAERHWDIGLAPLKDNVFNRAKLPTKYRDYGACHIAGVYSRLDPFEVVVTDGETGILVANDEDAWYAAIMKLVADPGLRTRMAAAAHAHVRSDLSLDQAVEVWRSIVDTLLPRERIRPGDAGAGSERKFRALQVRTERLTRQLEQMKSSAKVLLDERNRPLGRSYFDRVTRRLLRLKPSLEALPLISTGHDVLEFARRTEAAVGRDISGVAISENLQHVLYLEYAVIDLPKLGKAICVAAAAAVPGLDGLFGIELVDPEGIVALHLTQPIAQVDTTMLAMFTTGELVMDREGWRLRVFVRNSASPFFVYECGPAKRRTLLFKMIDASEM